MSDSKYIPVTPIQVGPGSQPEAPDGLNMAFMDLPDDMSVYMAPSVPEPEDASHLDEGIAVGQKILDALSAYQPGDAALEITLDHLNDSNLEFINQLLGEGEVSVQGQPPLNMRVQESVLAGVWRARQLDENGHLLRDTVEVGDVPSVVRQQTFSAAAENVDIATMTIPEDVYNAPPLLAELEEKLPEYSPGNDPHTINLSLLPHTERDLVFLSDAVGIGPVIILSRGYGNCRISSTATRNLWWVQYFNSQETLILNTLEISAVPEVACASPEDISDSAERLEEILSIYRTSH